MRQHDVLGAAVSELATRIEAGGLKFAFEIGRGAYATCWRELNVPIESQVLVFSKTGRPYSLPAFPGRRQYGIVEIDA